ncbi:MAG: helix-turn-helix transcriptional regulator, partial [Clostridiales bacterium]|nr:helix-turn-helix transcriptional regulator [Clostridiales bacterium]
MIDKILLKLREEMGISQEMAAKSLNVSRSALGYYERGERQPDASFIIKAADFFGVTAD